MELIKTLIAIAGTFVALLAFIKGLIEFVHLNGVRRYEKFHQMSVRFDANDDIQEVCALLHGSKPADAVTRQQKEVFICFLEEIYFMMKSRYWGSRSIMNRDLALYMFGRYGQLAGGSESFWLGLNKNEPFYAQFIAFCDEARSYQPKPHTNFTY